MANIQKRINQDGKTAYRVRVRMKGYPVQTATFPCLTDARKWAQQTEVAIREGRHFQSVEAKRHTVADLVERYEREVLPTLRSHAVRRQHLAWWRETIGAYLLNDVRPALLVECREKLRASGERSDSTVNRYMASLSHAFTVAMKGW